MSTTALTPKQQLEIEKKKNERMRQERARERKSAKQLAVNIGGGLTGVGFSAAMTALLLKFPNIKWIQWTNRETGKVTRIMPTRLAVGAPFFIGGAIGETDDFLSEAARDSGMLEVSKGLDQLVEMLFE